MACATAWLAVAAAATARAIEFPAQGDLAVEIVVEQPPASGRYLVRVPHFEALSLLVPPDAMVGVFTADGTAVAAPAPKAGATGRTFAVVPARDSPQALELWFQADAARPLFLVWRSEPSATKKPKPGPAKPANEPAAGDLEESLASAAPEGFAGELPIVAGEPGRVYRRSVWHAAGSAIRQASRAKDAALVTSGTFGDCEVTVQVRPYGGRPAHSIGLGLRVADRGRPDRAIRWLVGRADAGGQAAHVFGGLDSASRNGPGIAADGWTRLRARVAAGRAVFFVGDTAVAELPLPASTPAEGAIALVTQGGEAEFTELVVSDAAGGRLWAENPADGLAAADWHDLDAAVGGGFFRVVPADPAARLSCPLQAAFHRAPWRTETRVTVEPGAAAAWLFLPLLSNMQYVTLKLQKPGVAGHVEFATAPTPSAVFRRLPFTAEGLVCETSRPEFAHPDDVSTDAEVSGATLAAVQAMSFQGRRPKRFLIGYPQGHRHDFEAGRLLGFNCLHGPVVPKEVFEEFGYEKTFTHTKLMGTPKLGNGYDVAVNDAEMKKFADAWRAAGSLDRVHAISLYDEPIRDVTQALRGQPWRMGDVAAAKAMIRFAGLEPTAFVDPDDPPPPGLTPDDAEFWKHVRTARLDERAQNPQFVLDSMLLQAGVFPSRFGLVREAIRRHFGPDVLVTANVHDSHFMKGLPTDIEPFWIYGRAGVLDVPQACDYHVGSGAAMEFMIDLFRSAQRPHDHPIDAYQASQSHYLARPARSLRLRTMAAVAAGARSIQYYNYGPRYLATENWYDDDREKLQTIGGINHAVGWAEDALLDGRPRKARLAILWPRNGDLWDQLDGLGFYVFERQHCHRLARSLGHSVDFFSDQYPPETADFDRARVILMSQRCLPDEAARRLLDWVDRGGTLVASLSCGQLDGLARPSRTMLDAFGIGTLDIETANMHWKNLGLIPPRRVVDQSIETEGVKATVTPSDATVVATFDDGRPAVLRKARGKGQLIYSAFLLGWTLEKGPGIQAGVGELARPWLAAGGPPDCVSDDAGVSARLIEGPQQSAVVLVSSPDRDADGPVSVTISRAAGTPLGTTTPTSVESLGQGPLQFDVDDAELRFRLPVGLTDIVIVK